MGAQAQGVACRSGGSTPPLKREPAERLGVSRTDDGPARRCANRDPEAAEPVPPDAAQASWDAVADNDLLKVRLQQGRQAVWLTIERGVTLWAPFREHGIGTTRRKVSVARHRAT